MTDTSKVLSQVKRLIDRAVEVSKSGDIETKAVKPIANKTDKPRVSIVTGSVSDFEAAKIQDILTELNKYGVEVTYDVVSAHRTPEQLKTFADKAKEKGTDVIIAAAGGSAHLPAMTASFAHPKPVIALPVLTSSDTLGGIGAMLASLQMPPGASLTSVGVNAAKNAALEALKILSVRYPEIATQMTQEQNKARDESVVAIHTEFAEVVSWHRSSVLHIGIIMFEHQ